MMIEWPEEVVVQRGQLTSRLFQGVGFASGQGGVAWGGLVICKSGSGGVGGWYGHTRETTKAGGAHGDDDAEIAAPVRVQE